MFLCHLRCIPTGSSSTGNQLSQLSFCVAFGKEAESVALHDRERPKTGLISVQTKFKSMTDHKRLKNVTDKYLNCVNACAIQIYWETNKVTIFLDGICKKQ